MEENNIKDKAYKKGLIIIVILLMLLVFTSFVLAQTLSGDVKNNAFTFGTIKIDLGYYVNMLGDDGKPNGEKKFIWANELDDEAKEKILRNALVYNDPEYGELSETFKSGNETDEERYDILTREIKVKNDSLNDEYYRLYFSKVSGKLMDLINVKIIDVTNCDEYSNYTGDLDDFDDGTLLWNGKASNFVGTKNDNDSYKVPSFGEIGGKQETNENIKTLLIRFEYPSDDEIKSGTSHDEYEYALAFDLCAEAVQVKNQDKNDIKFN